MTPEYLKASEAARMCRVDVQTIYRWVKDGRLAAVRIGTGRSIRIPEQAVSDMLTRVDSDDSL